MDMESPENKAMNHLTKTQEDVHANNEVTQEDVGVLWREVVGEGVGEGVDNTTPSSESEKKSEPSKESIERLNSGFRDYFKGKTVVLRGSWTEYVFDEVVYDATPEGSYPFKLKFHSLSHPGDEALVDDKSLREEFLVSDKH